MNTFPNFLFPIMSVIQGTLSSRKRGRPPILVTEEVLQSRRLSKQRVNAARPKSTLAPK